MDIDEIVNELNERFAIDRPEYYKRRIIFWYDEEGQFTSDFDKVILNDPKIKKLKLTGNNNFTIKKTLCYDDLTSDFLVYTSEKSNCDDDDWLTDIKLYSEDFRSDKIDFWIKEMQLESNYSIRESFKVYSKFLNSKERRQKILSQKKKIASAKDIPLAILGAICDEENPNFANIMWKVFENSLIEDESYIKEIEEYDVATFFWETVKGLGYSKDEKSVLELAKLVYLNAFAKNVPAEYLTSLDITSAYTNTCYDIVSSWKQSKDKSSFKKISKQIEDTCNLPKVLNGLDLQDLLSGQFFSCINTVVLYKIMDDISNDIKDIDVIRKIVQKRKISLWYEDDAAYFESLQLLTDMWQFVKEHAGGYHTVEPEKIWQEYTTDYYKMDRYYRLFHTYADIISKNESEILGDLYKKVIEKVDDLYNNQFLKPLGTHWTHMSKDQLSQNGYTKIPYDTIYQNHFYSEFVNRRETKKIAVIISDALRYEVAYDVVEALREDELKAKIDLSSMQAIYPTLTEFGMTALLPQRKITTVLKNTGDSKEDIKVYADGKAAVSLVDRETILQSTHQFSMAFDAYDTNKQNPKDIIKMTSKERSDNLSGIEVVYVYHRTIDEAGHSGMVFSACKEAVTEIVNLVHVLKNENFKNIIITSDHGFLCTNKALTEDDKVTNSIPKEDVVQKGRRYILAKTTQNPDNLIPVKFFDSDSGLTAYTPFENVRIKVHSQNSEKFVHGGASLQEMVIPVIKFSSVRADSNEYVNKKASYEVKPVEIGLNAGTNRKITNLSFKLKFYQKDSVAGVITKGDYVVYFRDSTGAKISDEHKIVADVVGRPGETHELPEVLFKLRSQQYLITDSYYLVIQNQSGGKEEIEYQIDIATSVDGFDFFN